MTNDITLSDFTPVNLDGDRFYMTMTLGDFEITLEPHLVTGYCVGIYNKNEGILALEKRAVWLKNHPAGSVPPTIPGKIIERALLYANQLAQKYIYIS